MQRGLKAIVLGAGAFGSAIALDLARQGAAVRIVDPAPLAKSASGIAAGMLAPAFEAVLDQVSEGHFPILAAARDLWPGFVDGLGPTGLEACGALLRGPATEMDRLAAMLKAAGARFERIGETLFTPEDWRLEPKLALAAMRRGLLEAGGETISAEAASATATAVRLKDGAVLEADVVVVACGYGGLGLAPELSVMVPIKGQLLRFPEGGPQDGPILRSLLGYVVPSRDGTVAGATMEVGRADLAVDADATDRLKVEAAWLSPGLGLAHANALTGVRAATPDGLPLLGKSRSGVYVAAGARRNGWLLAPFAAAVLSRAITESPAADDPLYSPRRFSPG